MAKLRAYYTAMKPGIIYGNLMHAVVGVALAYLHDWSWTAVVGALAGTTLVIAAACLINNYIDRGYDLQMERTKSRPTVTGEVSTAETWGLALLLGIAGFTILALTTNLLTVLLGVVAFVWYIGPYTFSKAYTIHSTLIGTVPGALPAVAGYTALSGQFDSAALALFVVLVAWQMVHFYAIAIFRQRDYKAAGLKVISVVYSATTVHRHMVAWAAVHWLAVLALAYLLLHPVATALYVGATTWWLVRVCRGAPTERWGKQIFGGSLLVTLILLATSLVNLGLLAWM